MIATTRIAPDVIDILRTCKVDENRLVITQRLDPKMYRNVNKVLENLGGQWNRKHQPHMFAGDAAEVLAQAIGDGAYIDRKKTLQFYPTPLPIAKRLVELARVKDGDSVLEPSAGDGAIIEAIPVTAARITAVEIDAENVAKLRDIASCDGRIHVVHTDFLSFAETTDERFDAVCINPPFTQGQDIEHVIAAFGLLKPGGWLAGIMSEGTFFRSYKRDEAFRMWLDMFGGTSEQLPYGTFRESGTDVATRIIAVRRPGGIIDAGRLAQADHAAVSRRRSRAQSQSADFRQTSRRCSSGLCKGGCARSQPQGRGDSRVCQTQKASLRSAACQRRAAGLSERR